MLNTFNMWNLRLQNLKTSFKTFHLLHTRSHYVAINCFARSFENSAEDV